MKIYIYIIWFPTSERRYIGQTYNLRKRMRGHLNNKNLVGNALRKYDDWKVSILHTVKSRDEANRIEIEEIRNFNSVCPNGYNLTRGGEGGLGRQVSEETRKKLSVMGIGNRNSQGSIHSEDAKTKHKSKEHRKKISESRKGMKCPWVSKSNKQRMGEKRPRGRIRSKTDILKQQITVLRKKLDG